MTKNPLIRRYGYSLMRPRQFFIYLAVYCGVVAIMLLINFAIHKQREFFMSVGVFDMIRSLYYQFLGLELLILWVWGSFNSNSAIKEEVSEKSYDFFKLLPLSALSKATGILVGKNLVVILLACFNALCVFVLGMLAQANLLLQLQTFLVLFSVALLLNSVSLLSSIKPAKKGKSSNALVILLLGFLGLPWMFSAVGVMSRVDDLESLGVGFYIFEIPLLILISVLALYFFVWAICGIIRKFNNETEPLFSRAGSILFIALYEFIILGLFYRYFAENTNAVVIFFWVMSLIPALIIPLASIRSHDRYLENSGKSQGSFSSLFLYSNVIGCLILFAIWAGFAIGGIVIAGCDLGFFLVMGADFFSAYLFIVLLLELYVVLMPTYSKIGVLMVFIAAIYLILPMALSGILDDPAIGFYSLFGLLGGLNPETKMGLHDQMNVLAVNCGLCIVPLGIVLRQYSQIVKARQSM